MKNPLAELFYIPKYGKMSEKSFLRNIVLAVFVIMMCLTSMTLTAYAYFTAEVTVANQVIRAAHYDCNISIKKEGQEIAVTEGSLPAGSYTVTISKSEAEGIASTGFCVITIGNEVYHTQQIGQDGSNNVSSIEFNLLLGTEQAIRFMPHWGTSSHYDGYSKGENNEYYITNGAVVAIHAAQTTDDQIEDPLIPPETTQPTDAADQTGATDPATEPVTEPATEPVTEPATESATEPATEPMTEPATEPVTEPATEPTEEPDAEPNQQDTGNEPELTQPTEVIDAP